MLSTSNPGELVVFVALPTGHVTEVSLRGDMKVALLVSMLAHHKPALNADCLCVVHNGRTLDRQRSLYACGVCYGATLFVEERSVEIFFTANRTTTGLFKPIRKVPSHFTILQALCHVSYESNPLKSIERITINNKVLSDEDLQKKVVPHVVIQLDFKAVDVVVHTGVEGSVCLPAVPLKTTVNELNALLQERMGAPTQLRLFSRQRKELCGAWTVGDKVRAVSEGLLVAPPEQRVCNSFEPRKQAVECK